MAYTVKKTSLTALLTVLIILSFNTINAQCFEIESILVDACGAPEGENEMVRFKVGNSPLNASNLSVNWASSNNWLGICQNTSSANVISALNSTIQSCGFLIEPTGGVLPANSTVIFFTSTDIDIFANSFANLNDTLYAIFQCSGNTQGHFANGSGSGLRTLEISFSTPICNDIVTYDKGPLDNSNGASVSFDPAGIPSYYNNGCQAPFTPIGISAAAIPTSSLQICPGDSINLFGTLIGTIDSLEWTGGIGTFNNPQNDTTTYFSSIMDVDSFYIKIKGFNSCSTGISDSVLVYFVDSSDVSILEGMTANLCQGTSLTLNAAGASNYLWSTNATTGSININSAAQYFVTDTTNQCFPDSAFIQVTLTNQPTVTITENDTSICQGETVTLHANGGNNYTWNNAANTDSINVITSGSYFVYSTLPCPSDTDTVIVTVIQPTNVSILETNPSLLCTGASLTLHASPSSNNYTWSTSDTTEFITINSSGTFIVNFSDGICPNTSASINIIDESRPSATIVGNSSFCIGEALFLDATGNGNFLWSNGDNGNSTMITSPQEITLTATNFCGVATDIITISEIDCSLSDSTYIFIPNVITPNNDNLNDLFKVEGFGIESFSGAIYNRWGKLLFEWNDNNIGWDGTKNSEGTYFYVVEITFTNNETELFKGAVELLK